MCIPATPWDSNKFEICLYVFVIFIINLFNFFSVRNFFIIFDYLSIFCLINFVAFVTRKAKVNWTITLNNNPKYTGWKEFLFMCLGSINASFRKCFSNPSLILILRTLLCKYLTIYGVPFSQQLEGKPREIRVNLIPNSVQTFFLQCFGYHQIIYIKCLPLFIIYDLNYINLIIWQQFLIIFLIIHAGFNRQ